MTEIQGLFRVRGKRLVLVKVGNGDLPLESVDEVFTYLKLLISGREKVRFSHGL